MFNYNVLIHNDQKNKTFFNWLSSDKLLLLDTKIFNFVNIKDSIEYYDFIKYL